jgi:hypothetical protein
MSQLELTVQFSNYQEEITKIPTNSHRALLGNSLAVSEG